MTMIEKVARATFAKWRSHLDAEGHKSGPRTWDDMTFREREFALLAARAAIEAMKEPTGAMWKGAMPYMDSYTSNGAWYEAMIAAALAEEPSSR